MASQETTAPESQIQPAAKRTCRGCAEEKEVAPETWPYRQARKGKPYQAHGAVCLACEKTRKSQYEKRRGEIAVASVPATIPTGTTEEARKALTAASKLDVAAALKTGARVVNDCAPSVMARIYEYLEDPDHPHHLWALELLAQRILPRKLYEELGGIAAGVGSVAEKSRPTYVINVLPSQPATEGRVVSVVEQADVETVEPLALPATTEERE